MDFLRQQLDKVGKHFEKGGRWEPLYALWEMHDTILYTPGGVTKGPSHVRDGLDLKRMMITVVVALLPLCLWSCYNTGFQAFAAIGQGALPIADDPRFSGSDERCAFFEEVRTSEGGLSEADLRAGGCN